MKSPTPQASIEKGPIVLGTDVGRLGLRRRQPIGQKASESGIIMSSISGVGNTPNINPIQKTAAAAVQKEVPTAAANQNPMTDRVELSGLAPLLQSLKANNIRTDLVTSVKSQIDAGTYEDDNKLNVAVDRLLNDLT
jgi:anti-sigma28 factor (negative regulator of flagellin synthesis)